MNRPNPADALSPSSQLGDQLDRQIECEQTIECSLLRLGLKHGLRLNLRGKLIFRRNHLNTIRFKPFEANILSLIIKSDDRRIAGKLLTGSFPSLDRLIHL